MAQYDVALICLDGHIINLFARSSPEHNTKFCPECGEPTISQCPKCKADIRGEYGERGIGVLGYEFSYPRYCHNCGAPFPWTERRTEQLRSFIEELEKLSDEEKSKLSRSIPDIISETPGTSTAALRFKKAIAKIGKESGKLLTEIIVKVASECVKQQLGIQDSVK